MKAINILSGIISVLMLITFVSCNSEDDGLISNGGNATCWVNVTSSEGGTATTSIPQVLSGWKVTLTATPEVNYHFVNWTVNNKEVSRANPCEITVTTTTLFKANFKKDTYKINVTAGIGGIAKVNKNIAEHNEQVTFTAIPQEGYSFVNWSFIGKGWTQIKKNPYTRSITEDIDIRANFTSYKSTGLENEKEYVDLGLSVKWATYNIGATTPEGYGDYFAWGETTPKEVYDWSTYKWCNGDDHSMTKYCTSSNYGTVDNKTMLELSDDAARVNWGGSWRMPTLSEIKELINRCIWTPTTLNGVNGYKVTRNGNSIFIPTAGFRSGSYNYNVNKYAVYMTSIGNSIYNDQAARMEGNPDANNLTTSSRSRDTGCSIRPVCE